MNVKFNYLYRDAGNYKSWGAVIFRNPGCLEISEIEKRLRGAFFQYDLFIADQIGVPEVFLYEAGNATEDDVCFHEFGSIELINEASTDASDRTISDFLKTVEHAAITGWKGFDPTTVAR